MSVTTMKTGVGRHRSRLWTTGVMRVMVLLWSSCLPFCARAQGTLDREVGRSVPIVQITARAVHQQRSYDGRSLHQLSVPLSARLQLRPRLGASLRLSQTTVGGDGLEGLTGLSDAQVALDYALDLGGSRLVASLGVNLPTGATELSSATYETALQLGMRQYAFQTPQLGQGLGIAPGISYARPLGDAFVIGMALSYQYRGTSSPSSDLQGAYDWGNEVLLAFGADWHPTPGASVSADVIARRFEADRIDGTVVFGAGSWLTTSLQFHQTFGLSDLWLTVTRRDTENDRLPLARVLEPAGDKAVPGLLTLAASYRMWAGRGLCTTLSLRAMRYAETDAFPRLDVVGLGAAPEFVVSPALRVPLRVEYLAGPMRGLEVGVGLVALL